MDNTDRDFLQGRFYDFIDEFDKNRNGLGLPLGWVPATEYWWVKGDHFIGRIDILHRLTDALRNFGGHIGYEVRKSERGKGHGINMLKCILPHIKDMNIDKVLITCDKSNIPSQKIILSSGGELLDEILNDFREEPTQRYGPEL